MSRVAKAPVTLPKGVEVKIGDSHIEVKGPKGTLSVPRAASIGVELVDGKVQIQLEETTNTAMAGTMRALIANTVVGVSEGFERKLELVGVGYRASVQGRELNLSLGKSHPTVFTAPEGISIETPSQTEVLIKGSDKQLVGQVAAKVRSFRPPEPYKGKGVRYSGERIQLKEAKKA